MGGTYRAWNDRTYRWPPPDGWYRDDDGIWWAPGTGPRPPGRRPATTVHSPTPNPGPGTDRTVLGPDDGIEDRQEVAHPRVHVRLGQVPVGQAPSGPGGHPATTSRAPAIGTNTAAPTRPRRQSRVRRAITRMAVVASAMTLAAITGAGVLAVLVTLGHLSDVQELQDLREDLEIRLNTNTDVASTTQPAPATPVPTTIIELSDPDTDPLGPGPDPSPSPISPVPTISSEPLVTTAPTANRADFGERVDVGAPPSPRFRLGLGLG